MSPRLQAEHQAMIPDKGFNVVEEDGFGDPHERMTLIANKPTEGEARAVAKAHKKGMHGDEGAKSKVFVVDASGEWSEV